MRLLQPAPCRESAHGPGRLKRRNAHIALPDGDRNRFAFVPFCFENSLLPFLRRNESRIFVRQVDSGFPAQAHHFRVRRNTLDAEFFSDIVEKDIARIHNCIVQA